MDRFERDLKDVLEKGLTHTHEFTRSRRGVVPFESTAKVISAQNVSIIVDRSINSDEYEAMTVKLLKFVKLNQYYKTAKYRVFKWDDDGLEIIQNRPVPVTMLNKAFAGIETGSENESSLEKFIEDYRTYLNKAEYTILITKRDTVDRFRMSDPINIRNFVIIYKGDEGSERREKIHKATCIAYKAETSV